MAVSLTESTKRLSDILKRWVDEKSSRSVKVLAKQSGVSYPTALRAINCEGNTSLVNSLALLEVAATDNEKNAWLKEFHPTVIGSTKVNDKEFQPMIVKMLSLLGERSVVEIFCYLFDDTVGVDKRFIVEQYGERSQVFLDELKLLECLIEEGNKIRLDISKTVSFDIVLKLISSAITNLSVISRDTDFYHVDFYTGSFSREGVKVFKSYMQDMYQKIMKVEQDFPGEIRMEYGCNFQPLNNLEAKKLEGGI